MVGSTNRLPIALVLLLHVSLLLALPSSSTEAPTSSTDAPTSSTGATTSPYCEPKDRYTVNPTECVSESHAKGGFRFAMDETKLKEWIDTKVGISGNLEVHNLSIVYIALPLLDTTTTLNIEENSNLETIKLPSLKRVEYLYISRNPALKTLEINAAASGNQLYVRSNMILGQDSIDKLKRLNFTTLEIGTYGECSGHVDQSTSELDHCKSIQDGMLHVRDGATGGIPKGLDNRQLEVKQISVEDTAITTLSFLKAVPNTLSYGNRIINNPMLCDEDLFDKFSLNAGKDDIYDNCDNICDPDELEEKIVPDHSSPTPRYISANAEQLKKCTIFRSNKNPINAELLKNLTTQLPRMTEIEGKVEIVGTDWTDLSVLDKITKISSREDAGLEVRGNMRMEKFDLPNLKTVIAMGKTEEERIKIEGNKKKQDPKVFEGITSIQGNSVTGAQNSAGDAGQDGMGTGTLIGVVVGGVIGLIAVVAIVGFAVFWFVIRKKKQQTKKGATTPPKKKTLSSTGSNTDLTGGKKKGDAKPRPQSQPKSKEGLQKSADQRSKEPADQKAGDQKSADQEKSKQPEKHETSGPKDDLLFPEPE